MNDIEKGKSSAYCERGHMSDSSARELFFELGNVHLTLASPTNRHAYYFKGSVPDATAKFRFISTALQNVRVDELIREDSSLFQITDGVNYMSDAPLKIEVNRSIGIMHIAHGNRDIVPVRVITDVNKKIVAVHRGLRPRRGDKLIVFLSGVKAHHQKISGRVQVEAVIIQRSPYSVSENKKAAQALHAILQQNPTVSVENPQRRGGNIAFQCRTISQDKQPRFLWIVPVLNEASHVLFHEEADSHKIPLVYRDRRVASIIKITEQGAIGLSLGLVNVHGEIQEVRTDYPPGTFPQFGVNKLSQVYRITDPSEDDIPVIFQGCVLRIDKDQMHAAQIRNDALRGVL